MSKEDRKAILDEAIACVTKDRNATHGEAEDNFATIAEYWTTHLHARGLLPRDKSITREDVAIMSSQTKIARLAQSFDHRDNWVDGAGYMACGGGCAAERKRAGELNCPPKGGLEVTQCPGCGTNPHPHTKSGLCSPRMPPDELPQTEPYSPCPCGGSPGPCGGSPGPGPAPAPDGNGMPTVTPPDKPSPGEALPTLDRVFGDGDVGIGLLKTFLLQSLPDGFSMRGSSEYLRGHRIQFSRISDGQTCHIVAAFGQPLRVIRALMLAVLTPAPTRPFVEGRLSPRVCACGDPACEGMIGCQG